MAKQRKNIEVTAKITEPPASLTVPKMNSSPSQQAVSSVPVRSKYVKLLRVIEQLGRDLKPFYTGSKLCKTMPKVERNLVKACRLIKQCRVEAIKSSKKTCQ